MTRILDLEHASSHGTPVYVTVWDLTPPSMWTSAARGLGLGVFHTNVWFPDLSVEWAFGGHGYRDVSGIFSIPRDPIVLDAVHERVLAAVSDDSAAGVGTETTYARWVVVAAPRGHPRTRITTATRRTVHGRVLCRIRGPFRTAFTAARRGAAVGKCAIWQSCFS